MSEEKYICPCCGHKTLPEQAGGTYEICPVCGWEDDPVQLRDPDFEGGANKLSLNRAREQFENAQYERTTRLLGNEAVEGLKHKRVAVFGIGGVGGYCCEALARCGIGTLDITDSDKVCASNINRQIIATHRTIGMYKVDAMRERIADINPKAQVNVYRTFFLPGNAEEFPFEEYDYVVDAVDTVTAKLAIIERAKRAGVPVISAMGAGNKLDPTGFKVADIEKTKICPLAKVMRRELKKRGISGVKVVYSEEEALTPIEQEDYPAEMNGRRSTPGSIAFVPSVCGLILAGEVIKDLCK